MKLTLFFSILLCTQLSALAQVRTPLHFKEVWGYLMLHEEKYFPENSPFTDIGYFSAHVNADGNLVGGPIAKPALAAEGERSPRIHLVVTTPWSNDLMHLLLSPELPMRRRIIEGIIKRSEPFDGIQIDFESIAVADADNYRSFLREVRAALPRNKLLSVAVMARWESWISKRKNDPFDYSKIAPLVDRLVVMSYDEHSRSSKPGPIASLGWCKDILSYASKTVPREKLIMGLPLYGRAWQSATLARSYKGHEVEALKEQLQPDVKRSALDGASFAYRAEVTVTVFYEDLLSLHAKLSFYAQNRLAGVAFWRISQEPTGAWNLLRPTD